MRPFLTFLVPGLLLVCYDKPAELRKILKAAAKIEPPAAREQAIAEVAWNAL